ncbi:CHAD domain-containing protein [Rathayibacter sp. KR2-224]|uniref:CHAD domain-containing protein n=1 Tax=Rathayibacter sp. KR2-224 TaxID=3400913 RepID=UPI003C012378
MTSLDVVRSALAHTISDLEEFEAATRRGVADALHQARTRVRAVRSILSVYASVFDAGRLDESARGLKKLGFVLGAARDAEVRLHALEELGDASPELRSALAEPIASAQARVRATRGRAVRYLDSAEHAALAANLRRLAMHPDGGPDGGAPVVEVLARALVRASDRVTRAAKAATTEDLERLHSLRKAVRRLRYSAEAVAWAADEHAALRQEAENAATMAQTCQQLQDSLGDHRDRMLLAAELRDWSSRAEHPSSMTLAAAADRITREAERSLDELAPRLLLVHEAATRLDGSAP